MGRISWTGWLRRAVVPSVAVALVVSATMTGAPSSAQEATQLASQRRADPGRDLDGHRLRAADQAELNRALGVKEVVKADPNRKKKKKKKKARKKAKKKVYATVRAVPQAPTTGPDFEMPFTCGTSWTGSTRSSHSPSRYAVDFNAPDDLRKPVLASAPGTVVLVRSLTYSYGKYVVIDHGGGYTTLYAHLDSLVATVGQRVDQGDLIGYLGTTGGSTGPHLHFEQRRSGNYFNPYFSRTAWVFGRTAVSSNCGDRPVAGDWDGNGTDEVGVFRPAASGSSFFLDAPSGTQVVPWGGAADTPVVGDFDGDRVSQVGTKALGQATWQLRSASGAAAAAGVGGANDVPLAGDWDANGLAELGSYSWATRVFTLRWPDYSTRPVSWGASGRVPVVGDWNGDRTAEVGTFDAATGQWQLSSGGTTLTVAYGLPGDLPVVGNWDGDADDEIGVWRPSAGTFHLRHDLKPTSTDRVVAFGNPRG